MSPSVVSSAQILQTTDTLTHAVPLPSGSGGLLFGGVMVNGTPVVTPPSGYQVLFDVLNNFSSARHICFYRYADGCEGATSFSTDVGEQWAGRIFRITGVQPGEVPAYATVVGNNLFPDPPLLDPSGWGTEDTLWLALVGHVNGVTAVVSGPSGYSDFINDRTASAATGAGYGSANRSLTAASEDPGSFSLDGTNARSGVAATVAIRGVVVDVTPPAAPTDLTATLIQE